MDDLCKHGFFRPWLQRGLCPECEKLCECADMLAAGAYGGWWCPCHRDFTHPPKYAVDAVRKLHGKLLATANELHALKKQTPAGVKVLPQLDLATVVAGEPEDVRVWLESRRCANPRCDSWGCAKHDAGVPASDGKTVAREAAAPLPGEPEEDHLERTKLAATQQAAAPASEVEKDAARTNDQPKGGA